MGKFIDKTGWVMAEHGFPDSRLTVVQRAEDYIDNTGRHYVQWECQCSCPNHTIITVRGSSLSNGSVKSCGCLKSETAQEIGKNNKKHNQYRFIDNVVIGKSSNSDYEFFNDIEDFDIIKDCCWRTVVQCGVVKLVTTHPITKKPVFMHQYLGYKNYDHIDRNELNNCKSNLRAATVAENNQNHSLRKDNCSGISGVHFDEKYDKWMATISVNGKRVFLGRFEKTNFSDAVRARLQAEKQYYGEFSPQRHLFEEYEIF